MSTTTTRRPHRQTAFNLKRSPFPTEAMGKDDDPYSEEAFADEIEQIIDKVIVAGLSGRRQLSFVYSHNQLGGEDTGFGKSKTMMNLRTVINEDLGASILEGLVDEENVIPVGAAYASFNTNQRTGYYPVLAEAVRDAAWPATSRSWHTSTSGSWPSTARIRTTSATRSRPARPNSASPCARRPWRRSAGTGPRA